MFDDDCFDYKAVSTINERKTQLLQFFAENTYLFILQRVVIITDILAFIYLVC